MLLKFKFLKHLDAQIKLDISTKPNQVSLVRHLIGGGGHEDCGLPPCLLSVTQHIDLSDLISFDKIRHDNDSPVTRHVDLPSVLTVVEPPLKHFLLLHNL